MNAMILIFGGMTAVAVLAYLFWDRIKVFFGDSETLFLARLQILLGGLMAVDLAPILPGDWLPYYVIAMGVLTELGRRSRASDV